MFPILLTSRLGYGRTGVTAIGAAGPVASAGGDLSAEIAAPAGTAELERTKGATGRGARTPLRYLAGAGRASV